MEQLPSFSDWRKILLEKRGLNAPDSRPLYQYRLTEQEFSELEGFLQDKIALYSTRSGLDYISERPGYPELFVLYCSEWWRRRYDGTGYAWEPILTDLGADSSTWNANDRSECVRAGLHGWKLRTLRTGGHRYLGAVALQGGLPLRLLADERGRISQVISRVLRLARRTVESPQDLQSWVESLQTLLPISYRQREIYTLLADVAWTVLDLKAKAELTAGSNAIAKLDRMVPRWRERFPLPVEDSHAIALIDHLVREAATIRLEKQALILPIVRNLELKGEGVWTLRSALNLPDKLDCKQLTRLFEISEDDMPRTGELELIVGEKSRVTAIRKMAGHDSYKVNISPWGFSGEMSCNEHLIRLTAPDGRVWTTSATKGQTLDEGLPWLFSGESESPALVHQGSGSIADQKGYVALPSGWEIQSEEGQIESVGYLPDLDRAVFSIVGRVTASDTDNNDFKIRTGSASAREESFEWLGNRLWYGFKSPSVAFVGKPQLFSVDEDGVKKRINGEVDVTVIGSPNSRVHYGPVMLKYPTSGEPRIRTRMVLLPEESEIKLIPDSARSGVIYFKGWGIKNAQITTTNVNSRFVSSEGSSLLELSVEEGEKTPDELEITTFWPNTTTPAKLVLPFPAKGVRLFDRSGIEVTSGGQIAVQELLGTRLIVFGASQYSRMTLKVRATNKDISRKFEIRNSEGLLSLVLRLSDFRSDLEHLLTIDDNTDASAILELVLDGKVGFFVEIKPYACRPERDGSDIWVDFGHTLEGTDSDEADPTANAIRLDDPGDEAQELVPTSDLDPRIMRWRFDPESRESGAWLVFPPVDSQFYFRPTRWHINGNHVNLDLYQTAILTKDDEERQEALDRLIAELAADFQHPCWEKVDQLVSQVGHLPLATLDLWKRFARSSTGMSSLIFRFGNIPISFLLRFSSELPFCWETVSARDWARSVELTRQQCVASFGKEHALSVLSVFLESRMNDLVSTCGSLHYLFGILKAAISEDARIQRDMLKVGGMQSEAFLFKGENSPLNKLRQHHFADNEEWPVGLNNITNAGLIDKRISKYLCQEQYGFHDSIINLPLLLAAQVCCDTTSHWFAEPKIIHQLRQYKNFDPDWFDEAFNQTVARCLADGLFDN